MSTFILGLIQLMLVVGSALNLVSVEVALRQPFLGPPPLSWWPDTMPTHVAAAGT